VAFTSVVEPAERLESNAMSSITVTTLQSQMMAPAAATPTSTAAAQAPVRPSIPRRSSSLHKMVITKLRPLPFQYLYTVWHSKSGSKKQLDVPQQDQQQSNAYHLSLLVDSIADIGAFYRVFNNLPWSAIRPSDSIHIFRAGVTPLWEDEENLRGGRWLIRVKNEHETDVGDETKRKDVRTWEEICLLCLGGELQSVIAQGT
jgi:hypothetical protein